MTIQFRCHACGKLLRVAQDAMGKQARCPECGNIQQVPATSDPGFDAGGAFPAAPPVPTSAAAGGYAPAPSNSPPSPVTPGATQQAASYGGTYSPPPGPPYAQAPAGLPFAPTNPYADAPQATNPYAASGSAYPGGYTQASASAKIRPPAIAMLLTAGLPMLLGLFLMVIGLIAMADGEDEAIAAVVVGMISIAVGVVPAFAGLLMLRLQAHGACMTMVVITIVLSMLSSCVPLAGVAIWAVVVLSDSRVRAAFR